MVELDHARQLLKIAERDLRAASAMVDSNIFTDEIFGFQAQQAVEKCLKAWLTSEGVEYPKIHDLDELFQSVSDTGTQIPGTWRTLAELTPFAVQLRYDTMDILGEDLNRQDICGRIKELIVHVAALAEMK